LKDGGLAKQINEFIGAHPDTRLVIIDTLEYIRDDKKCDNIYSADCKDIIGLREITNAHKITLLLIHHTRKMYDADPVFQVSGSTGLSGTVDGIWVIEKESRDSDNAKLTIANRDTEGYCFGIEFNRRNCKWEFRGNYEEIQEEADDLVNALKLMMTESNEWSGTPTELCEKLRDINSKLKFTPASLGKKLRSKAAKLKKEFGIIVEIPDRTSEKRGFIIKKQTDDVAE
jgi:hypothetical protein